MTPAAHERSFTIECGDERRPVWDYNARGDDGILAGQVG